MNKNAPSHSGLSRLWTYSMKNKNLGKFVEAQFSIEKKVHALILDFENGCLPPRKGKG